MVAEPRFGSPDLNLGFATPPAMAAAAAASSAVGAGTLLTVGAGEVAMIDAINAWSARVDASLGMISGAFTDLRTEVLGTQAVLTTTIHEAKIALNVMHEGFKQALGTSAAEQRGAVEALIMHARVKFLELETKLEVLHVSAAQAMSSTEQWALGEAARTTAALRAAEAPPVLGTPPPSPRLDPFARQDPWQNYGPLRGGAAAFQPHPQALQQPAPLLATPPGVPQQVPQSAMPLGSPAQLPQSVPWATGQQHQQQQPGPHRDFRIDSRGWSSHQKPLDAGVSAEAFQVWRERALVFLAQGRQDVRRLLTWAEGETAAEVLARATDQSQMPDFEKVNFALHGAIMGIIGDSLLGRARCSNEHGALLWRNLCTEWAGSAPQYRHAKAKQFQDPPRAKDMTALWAALPAWERLGEEVRTAGFDLPEWVKSAALEKLIPLELLRTLISRPELDSLNARLAWIRSQMEHARGSAQMLALAGGGRGKDASGDVLMGALAPDVPGSASVVWSLQAERGRLEFEGDWVGAAALSDAINALGKGGKGKGGKGGGGRGPPAAWSTTAAWGKGAERGSKGGGGGAGPSSFGSAGAADAFRGACHHCGIEGHRKRDCKKLDAEMAARRQGGPGGGGKGGGKGKGKGGLYECGADDAGADDPAGAHDGAGPDAAGEVWWFESLGFLGTGPAPAPVRQLAARRPPGPELHNRFAVLDEGELEDEVPAPPAPFQVHASRCSGCPRGGCGLSVGENFQPLDELARGHRLRGPRPRGKPRRVAFADCWQQVGDDRAHKRDELSLLLEGSPDGLLAAVGSGLAPGEKVIEVVVDSGAVQSVAPPGLFPGTMEPSAMSRAGRTYRAANGSQIRNLGQVRVPFVSSEGHKCSLPFQVAEVEHALLSVGHLAAAGNRVELHEKGGTITHIASGKTMSLMRRGGVYVLQLRVSGFPRPVAK